MSYLPFSRRRTFWECLRMRALHEHLLHSLQLIKVKRRRVSLCIYLSEICNQFPQVCIILQIVGSFCSSSPPNSWTSYQTSDHFDFPPFILQAIYSFIGLVRWAISSFPLHMLLGATTMDPSFPFIHSLPPLKSQGRSTYQACCWRLQGRERRYLC